MSRPCKLRRVCLEPNYKYFGPKGATKDDGMIVMTVDEFECIRLIDLEGITQEQCADSMDIARTTVQSIYKNAREKIARCIVKGCILKITGGNYRVCDGNAACIDDCICKFRHRNILDEKKENTMRLAITYDNGEIFQHFGKTESFKVYDIEDGKIVKSQVLGTNGKGHGALAGILKDNKVDTLICGGIGGGAKVALSQAGIKLYGGVTGNADESAKALIDGKLSYNENVECSHHDHEHGHEHGHVCSDHGCK